VEDDDLVDEFWEASLAGDSSAPSEMDRLLDKSKSAWGQQGKQRMLGRFEVLGDLGAGGLGRVYLCWDPELRREVAIKVIARDLWAVNEARSIARLDHRAVVKVFEVGQDRIVMELLDGGSLADQIKRINDGAPSPLTSIRARLHCLVRIAEGLAYCHERGILHRDVKPDNVLFANDDEHPRLVDFGLAHIDSEESLNITQNLVGSPAYLAPEQIESGETGSDARSDIFSFGVLAQELLTLEQPFLRESRTATLAAIQRGQVQPVYELSKEIPRPIGHVIQHCLEVDPLDRYQSMDRVFQDLRDALANRPISVGTRSAAHRTRLLYRRNRRVTQVAVGGVGLTLALVLALWVHLLQSERTEFREEIERLSTEIQGIEIPGQFHATALTLAAAKAQAESLDVASVGHALFGPSITIVQDTIELWSTHLREVVEQESDIDRDHMPSSEWKSIFSTDNYLAPESTLNNGYRERGRVYLSDELIERGDVEVLIQVERGKREMQVLGKYLPMGVSIWFSCFRDYVPTQLYEYPKNGSYRFRIPGVWERELVVRSQWDPPIVIELTPRRLSTEGWFADPEGKFLASPIITKDQASGFPGYRDQNPNLENGATTPDSAYHCTWDEAQEFAAWAGGRLPLGQEVGGVLKYTGDPSTPYVYAEYTTGPHPGELINEAMSLHYKEWRSKPNWPPRLWVTSVPVDMVQTVTKTTDGVAKIWTHGFRILYDTSP
jgi:hypothetical protein